MDQPFDSSNIDVDIDSLAESMGPVGFAFGGPVESMHLTPYNATNQESGDFQDAHSMPMTYSEGGEVEDDGMEIGDYSHTRPKQGVARQMLQRFADGGPVPARVTGGLFDIGPPPTPTMSQGLATATAPTGIGMQQYNKNIADFIQNNIHHNPSAIAPQMQRLGASPTDVTSALGGQATLESRFREVPSYQTRPVTDASGVTKQVDFFGPATMLTGGTGQGANWQAPIVTSRPRMLVDVTPGLSASQQHARNLVAGDTALQQAFQRTGLPMNTQLAYDFQRQLDTGQITPDQLQAKFDPMAYEMRVKEAYANIGRTGMGNDLSTYHPSSMGEMFKAYFNPNATTQEMEAITARYAPKYGTNWNAAQANKVRTEVLIPSLQAQDYYMRNPDVSNAFANALKADPNTDYAQFAQNHYNQYGRREGRTWNSNITVGAFEAPTAEEFAKIDPSGYNYWINALKSGAVKPGDFEKEFYGGVTRYAGPYQDLYKTSMDKAAEYIRSKNIPIQTTAPRTLPGVTRGTSAPVVDVIDTPEVPYDPGSGWAP
ncbi:MAG: hypothetical protein RL509_1134 [Pseudomonadota bacterium]